ncbi:hypothetical protein ACWDZ6_24275 [Streptomyces sp. NPDC002926]
MAAAIPTPPGSRRNGALDGYSVMASGTQAADDDQRHGEPEPSITCW